MLSPKKTFGRKKLPKILVKKWDCLLKIIIIKIGQSVTFVKNIENNSVNRDVRIVTLQYCKW